MLFSKEKRKEKDLLNYCISRVVSFTKYWKHVLMLEPFIVCKVFSADLIQID